VSNQDPSQAGGAPTDGGTATDPNPQTQVPEGHVVIPKEEAEKLERYRQQLAGMNRFVQAARAVGITRPEDFSKVSRQDADPEPEADEPTPSSDDKVGRGRAQANVSELVATEFAKREHMSAFERETTLIEELANQIAGAKATPEELDIIRAAAQAEFDKTRKGLFYEPDHPLATEFHRPVGKAEAAKVAEGLKKKFAAVKGSRMASIADSARSPAPTVGNPAGQGGPSASNNNKPPSNQDVKAEAAKFLADRAARRAGNVMTV
jgi:hypothetical protein